MKLTITGPFTEKDQLKSNRATRFIGHGSARSSTHQYMKDWGHLANCGDYIDQDIVFVSVEGARPGRKSLNVEEVLRAVKAKVVFITDIPKHRERPYNVGEREIADLLKNIGYYEIPGTGEWHPANNIRI